MSRSTPETESSPYHHGNLRAALIEAAIELARVGGSRAVVLREVTRRVGVTARAAYRHFKNRDALLDAVTLGCLAKLAERIERELVAQLDTDLPSRGAVAPHATFADPLAALIAIGDGYIAFVLEEPGWFDAAMFVGGSMALAVDPAGAGQSGYTAYQLLEAAIAGLVQQGVLPVERAQSAAVMCWSTVHGFAVLSSRGPMRELTHAAQTAAGRELVRGVAEALRTK